jgi:hypothetical protein
MRGLAELAPPLGRLLIIRRGKGQRDSRGDLAGKVTALLPIRIEILACLQWVKICPVQAIRVQKTEKKACQRFADSIKPRAHHKTGKSVDALVAVSLQRRFTLKFHPQHNDS